MFALSSLFHTPFLHSFTFRLAWVYVGLFSLSVTVLFALIYNVTTGHMERQATLTIERQSELLQEEYARGGVGMLTHQIERLTARDNKGEEIYLLVNRQGMKLAGNVKAWPQGKPKSQEWLEFSANRPLVSLYPVPAKAMQMELSEHHRLLVGRLMLGKQQMARTLFKAFWASLLIIIGMAFLGAVIITRSVGHRLGVINRSAEQIMQGNMATRIPYSEGGDEFDTLAKTLNDMLATIDTLMASLNEFAASIAHDLRTPLNRINSRTEAGLRELEADNPARELLQKNSDEITALINTFNAILHIGELESGGRQAVMEPCDLPNICEQLVELYQPVAEEKSVNLTATLPDGLTVKGEKHLLTQAFANIIDNAIKFSPAGGRVMVEAGKHANGQVWLAISDSGPGIKPDFRHKVFEKFYRLEASRSTQGSGLGLSLVGAVMRIHKADIELADNQPGLKVVLNFPLYNKAL